MVSIWSSIFEIEAVLFAHSFPYLQVTKWLLEVRQWAWPLQTRQTCTRTPFPRHSTLTSQSANNCVLFTLNIFSIVRNLNWLMRMYRIMRSQNIMSKTLTLYKNTEIENVTSTLPPIPSSVSCCQTGQPWVQWATSPQQHPSLPQAPGKRGMSMSLRTCAITSYTNCMYPSWRDVTLWECLLVSVPVSPLFLTVLSMPNF